MAMGDKKGDCASSARSFVVSAKDEQQALRNNGVEATIKQVYKKWFGAIVIGIISVFIIWLYPNMRLIVADVVYLHSITVPLIASGVGSATPTLSPHFIPRPDLQQKVLDRLLQEPDGSYTLVYGPRGSGKSTLMSNTLAGRKATATIRVKDASSTASIMNQISKFCGVPFPVDDDRFTLALKRTRAYSGTPPTIVFDVERRKSYLETDIAFDAIRSLAKDSAEVAHVFIVLSEADTVMQFGSDMHREKYIFVGEMEEDEADALITNTTSKLSLEDRHSVFANIGTNAALLREFIGEIPKMSVAEFIGFKLRQSRQGLARFPLRNLLAKMNERGNITTDELESLQLKDGDIALWNYKSVGPGMKASEAIIYRMELFSFEFSYTAHRRAARSLDL
jgi:energy-coupling factor transporter ATP-binding protein EcfA2